MKTNLYTLITFGFLLLLVIFGMWSIGKGQDCKGDNCTQFSLMGWVSVIFAIVIFVYILFRDRTKTKIPFHKIKQNYIKSMEEREKITINPLAKTWKLTEEGNRYVFVLCQDVDDIPTYYMCEADMYTGHFGRGFGEYTEKQTEAYYWYTTRKKVDVADIMKKELTKQNLRELQIKAKSQEELLRKFGNKEEFK